MKTAAGEGKEISDTAARQQAAAVGSGHSDMFKSFCLPNWTPNLVPNQLTIFYGGQVNVFESIPADKAREIMLMAATADQNRTNHNLSSSSASLLKRSPSMQNTANAFNPLCRLQSTELPFTRTRSLQRFFEKRRDRLVNKTPYATNTVEGKETNNHS